MVRCSRSVSLPEQGAPLVVVTSPVAMCGGSQCAFRTADFEDFSDWVGTGCAAPAAFDWAVPMQLQMPTGAANNSAWISRLNFMMNSPFFNWARLTPPRLRSGGDDELRKLGQERICFLIFLVKVCVHLPCVASYSMISRISLAFTSSGTFELLMSIASCEPSNVEGAVAFTTTAALPPGLKCDGLVFVTSRNTVSDSARRPVPLQLGQVVELPPKALLTRPSPPQIPQVSRSMGCV